MAKKKITTKKRESIIEKNKARNANLLDDAELSDVSTEFCYCEGMESRQHYCRRGYEETRP